MTPSKTCANCGKEVTKHLVKKRVGGLYCYQTGTKKFEPQNQKGCGKIKKVNNLIDYYGYLRTYRKKKKRKGF